MADEKPVENKTPPPDDGIKNLKAEFDRKIGNIEKTNQALLTQLQVLAQQPKPAPEQQKPKAPLKDIWYDDPDKAASLIAQRAKDDTMAQIRSEQAEQNKKNTVISGLYREYPELQSFDHPLTEKAIEYFDKMTPEEKANPIAYKLAVKEAAEELEIKPKAKRKAKEDDDETFSLGSNSQGGKEGKTRGKKSGELDQRTIDFAKLVGLNTDDEKVMNNLKKRADRKNWMTWE